jgi:hypothetical protein
MTIIITHNNLTILRLMKCVVAIEENFSTMVLHTATTVALIAIFIITSFAIDDERYINTC